MRNPFKMHNIEIAERRRLNSVPVAILKKLDISKQTFYDALNDHQSASPLTIKKMMKDTTLSEKTMIAYENLLVAAERKRR